MDKRFIVCDAVDVAVVGVRFVLTPTSGEDEFDVRRSRAIVVVR